MTKLRVMGFDPSMRNWGIAAGEVDVDTLELEITHLSLIETKADSKNKTVRKASLDFDRAKHLHTHVTRSIAAYNPQMVMIEMPIGSQNAAAMKSYGMILGLIASVSSPIIQLTPSEVKIAATGNKYSTKDDMIYWATAEHPEANWLKRAGKIIKKNEHLADAVAAIYAGMLTDQFRTSMEMYRLAKAS